MISNSATAQAEMLNTTYFSIDSYGFISQSSCPNFSIYFEPANLQKKLVQIGVKKIWCKFGVDPPEMMPFRNWAKKSGATRQNIEHRL